ncbi:protein of unknown function DUF1703 [Dissulfuribacter thermophilus]|uniref:AAA-ATPase-like domain-containing protein n=1 Tax=Dissulfuribacter thermophilus TaxID=1156395 RepID=A0A1B9F2M7_9BACT|nr:AAA family ATPase [Dissulfuribacter thermophilus]OCC14188.1 protein of unknown function DUF1703 [Dissulfuribacter thermophilus]
MDIGVCYFLARPRRFGKSLTINTLYELFNGNKAIFEGLYIYDSWNFKRYPVLVFAFNGVPRGTLAILTAGLKRRLMNLASSHDVDLSTNGEPGELFQELIGILLMPAKVKPFMV